MPFLLPSECVAVWVSGVDCADFTTSGVKCVVEVTYNYIPDFWKTKLCIIICSCTCIYMYIYICGECVCMYSVLRCCMLCGLKMEMIGFNTAADAKACNAI